MIFYESYGFHLWYNSGNLLQGIFFREYIGLKTRELSVLIRVMYKDGKLGEIENYLLDDLICSNKIKKFQRSSGWVTIGVDPIREVRRDDYLEIPQREKNSKKLKKRQ